MTSMQDPTGRLCQGVGEVNDTWDVMHQDIIIILVQATHGKRARQIRQRAAGRWISETCRQWKSWSRGRQSEPQK
jgi:hypothetical protein